jgi:hypothetical protein
MAFAGVIWRLSRSLAQTHRMPAALGTSGSPRRPLRGRARRSRYGKPPPTHRECASQRGFLPGHQTRQCRYLDDSSMTFLLANVAEICCLLWLCRFRFLRTSLNSSRLARSKNRLTPPSVELHADFPTGPKIRSPRRASLEYRRSENSSEKDERPAITFLGTSVPPSNPQALSLLPRTAEGPKGPGSG